jgi:hypothetical protein
VRACIWFSFCQGWVSELSGGSQEDLVDGEVAGAAEGEGDDFGDVVGGDLGLVVELLDAVAGLAVGDVVGSTVATTPGSIRVTLMVRLGSGCWGRFPSATFAVTHLELRISGGAMPPRRFAAEGRSSWSCDWLVRVSPMP